ncbi:2-dehydro-3-deoxy-D-gluconate 5-dehydrogenase [Nymphon striatum]|nr:2-dehydro-3-deoxy-D-gluconate 5-dehydrogenase [Nymphon striatum]
MKNIFDLKDKVAIITGGAGALGSGLAEALASHGCDVVLTGRTIKTLEEAVQKVESVGRRALAVKCDVTSEADNEEVVRQTISKFGKVDILITVAGIAKRFPAEEFPADAFDQIMDINVKGTFLACKAVSKQFIKQGYGKIITVSSVRAFAGHPGGYAAYGTSKGAINLLTKQLATEWAKYNINVNSIAPTIFWTPLTKEVLEDEKLKNIFLSRIPLGRAAVVDDMVGATVYFASGASDFITGQVLYVDGGCTAG